jgi:hypothetical protein
MGKFEMKNNTDSSKKIDWWNLITGIVATIVLMFVVIIMVIPMIIASVGAG